jgi:hypothetical protein
MAKLIIRRGSGNTGMDYFLQINDESYRLKRGETKTVDLPAGNHTLKVKIDSVNKLDYPINIQNDSEVKRLEIKSRIPRLYNYVMFGVLAMAITGLALVMFNILERKILVFVYPVMLIGVIINIYTSFKYYGKNFYIRDEDSSIVHPKMTTSPAATSYSNV